MPNRTRHPGRRHRTVADLTDAGTRGTATSTTPRPAAGSRQAAARSRRCAGGTAPMGGRTPAKDAWGDGMINEEDRGSAHDY